jgi:signal transduction histidine kinase
LQELSRVEAGQIALEQEPVRIGKLIASATARLRPQFDDKNIALEVTLNHDLPITTVDPNRIIQVLVNLLGNALQFTPAGGTVTVRPRIPPMTSPSQSATPGSALNRNIYSISLSVSTE